MSVTSKPPQWGPNHNQTADDYTLPGVWVKRLLNRYGLYKAMRDTAWYVDAIKGVPERVTIVRLHAADSHYTTADYAELSDGRRLPTFYLFPVVKHCKPVLRKIRDEHGETMQWVAPWRKGVLRPWE